MQHENTFAGFFKAIFDSFDQISDEESELLWSDIMLKGQRNAVDLLLERRREILMQGIREFDLKVAIATAKKEDENPRRLVLEKK